MYYVNYIFTLQTKGYFHGPAIVKFNAVTIKQRIYNHKNRYVTLQCIYNLVGSTNCLIKIQVFTGINMNDKCITRLGN